MRGKPDDSWAVRYCGITCPHLRQGLRAVFAFCTSPPHTLLPAETALRSDLFPFLPWHTAGTQVWLCDQVTCAPSHSLSSLSTRYLQRSQKRSPLWDGHGTGWKQPGARVHLGTAAMNAGDSASVLGHSDAKVAD